MKYKLKIYSFFNINKDYEIYRKAINNSVRFCKGEFLKVENGNIYYRNKDNDEFSKIKIVSIYYDVEKNMENFCSEITEKIQFSHKWAYLLKNEKHKIEPVFGMKPEHNYLQYVYSNACYVWDRNTDILKIVADTMYEIARNQYIYNGNKRTALLSMAILLKKFNFKISYFDDYLVNGNEKFVDRWYDLTIEITKYDALKSNDAKKMIYNELLIYN